MDPAVDDDEEEHIDVMVNCGPSLWKRSDERVMVVGFGTKSCLGAFGVCTCVFVFAKR